MTRRKGERYFEYLDRVKINPDAVLVKIADMEHNMDLSRFEIVTEKDLKRVYKYNTGMEYITN